VTLAAPLATAVVVYLALGLVLRGARTGRTGRRAARVSAAQTWLAQAGVELTPRQFAAGSAFVAAVVFLVLLAVTATPAVALVPALMAAGAPRAYFARQRTRRLRSMQDAWPDGIRDLLARISAGMSLHQALLGLAEDGPPALRDAFARYPTLARVVGVVPALELIEEELADPTSDRIIEVLILAHQRGGHVLGDILRDLADATTRDGRAAEEIHTDGLEQRINAKAVFVLPWLVLLVLTAQAGPFRDFYGTAAGVVVIVIGAAMSLAGSWIVGRLGRQPVEERVLGGRARRVVEEAA
jgi:tight adherence protein B